MPTYSEEHFERISAGYKSTKSHRPHRTVHSQQEMTQIANTARKLLRHLEVHDPTVVDNGPGAIALLERLASAHGEREGERACPQCENDLFGKIGCGGRI
jgi:hypothetical protein